MDAHFYNVDILWTKDRQGEMSSPELSTKVEIATPPQFPKGIEGIWSPEHLFTSAVASCLMTTFLSIAENSKFEFTEFSCKSHGKIGTGKRKIYNDRSYSGTDGYDCQCKRPRKSRTRFAKIRTALFNLKFNQVENHDE